MKVSSLLGRIFLVSMIIVAITAIVTTTSTGQELNSIYTGKSAVLEINSFIDPAGDPVDNDVAPTGDPVDNDVAPT